MGDLIYLGRSHLSNTIDILLFNFHFGDPLEASAKVRSGFFFAKISIM
jgi:hypothetical protein